MMKVGQACRGVVNETCSEWMTFECAQGQHNSCEHLEPHACACDGQRCATLTTLRKMCVRQGVLSSQTPRILLGLTL